MIDFNAYLKHWPGDDCYVELNPEFAAKLNPAQQKEAIKTVQVFILELCNNEGREAVLKELMASPLFDPNAVFTHDETKRKRPGRDPSVFHLPLISIIYNNVGSSMVYGRLGDILPHGLLFPNGERIKDPNDGGSMMQPLYASLLNENWNLKALLSHPDVNPNIGSCRRGQYLIQAFDDGKTAFTVDARSVPEADSPINLIADLLDRMTPERYNDARERNAFKKQYASGISSLVDAGARMSEETMEICNKNKTLKPKMDAIYSRISHIIAGKEAGITVQDIKHAYAIDRLGEVFLAAHEDEELAREIIAASHELPQWLYAETHAALSLLETGIGPGWVGSTEADRASGKKGDKEPD